MDEIYRYKSLNLQKRLELNTRIIALKPSMKITHKPRSILDRSFFTANEFRSLLWYYLKFALYGLLSKELIKHFTLLSEGTYILSKNRITKNEITTAGAMLNRFADDFELFYSKNAVTINIHMLRHYSNSVLDTGPLWCHSMFCFESNIGEIKRSFNCTVDVVEQIAFNYSIRAASELVTENNNIEQLPKILRLKEKTLTSEQYKMLEVAGLEIQTNQNYKIGHEMFYKKQVFKSNLSVTTKSIDHFIELADESIGSIEFFIQIGIPYILVKKYDVIKSHSHLIQIQPNCNNVHQLLPYDSIHQKLIYLKFTFSKVSFIEIVTKEPNRFEGN